MSFKTITYEEDDAIGWLTLNRPDDGNMFTAEMCHEIRDCINDIRRETRTRVLVITGAGDKFFCIGGRKDGLEDSTLYAGMLPTLEIYESIEKLQKPVIAMVNGYAVGGGQVLQVISTWTDPKVFRTPHTYELRYTRLPRDYEARPNAVCDPYDEERAQLFSGQPPR